MDELGMTVPRTREELAAFVATVKEKRPDLVPIAFTGANWFLDEITNTLTEQGATGFFNSVRYNQGGKWNGPEYKAAFDAIVGLYADGIFGRDTLDLDYGRAVELFQRGQAVAFLQGTWESGILSAPYREANGIKLSNVTASGLPVLVEGGKPAIRSFIEVGLAVPKNSPNKELATKFVEFVTAGGGVDQWSDSLLVVPTAKGYTLDTKIFSTENAALGYAEISQLLLNPSSDRNNVSDFSAVAGDAIIDSVLNGTDSQKQIDYLQSEWDSGRYSNAL
jgi:raffinose/stachyose/melibiose transport system substrate-binding protein